MRYWTALVGLVCACVACSTSSRNFGDGSEGGDQSAAPNAGTLSNGGTAPSGATSNGGANDASGASSTSGSANTPAGAGAGESSGDGGGAGALSEGGAAGQGSDAAAGQGGEVAAAPPGIVSVSPADKATGVLADTPIKLTFSEAMDTTSVENALGVSTFTADKLDVSWASGGKSVTIAAIGGWKYASGTDLGIAALKYVVTLGSAAKDAQGHALGTAFSSSFSTRRRITQTIAASSVGSYSDYGHAVGDGPLMCASDTDNIILDKWSGQASAGTYYAFIAFDAAALGASASNTIEAATFRATQTAPTGDFYATHEVTAAKVAYHAIDKDVLATAVTADLGIFASSANTLHPSLNVLTSFKSDFEAGQKLHLFKLSPNLGSADSTVAHFACGDFSLEVTHVLP